MCYAYTAYKHDFIYMLVVVVFTVWFVSSQQPYIDTVSSWTYTPFDQMPSPFLTPKFLHGFFSHVM